MKLLIQVLFILSLLFIVAFFVTQGIAITSNVKISGKIQTVFGIGLVIISACVFIFLVITLLGKKDLPSYIEVNLFEIFITAVVIGVVGFYLILKQ